MQNPSFLSRYFLVGAIAALVFAGCSANGSQFNPSAPATALQARNQSGSPVSGQHKTAVSPLACDGCVTPPPFSQAQGGCIVTYSGWDPYTNQYTYVSYFPVDCNPDAPSEGIAPDPNSKHTLFGVSTGSTNFIAVENSKGKLLGTLNGLTGNPVGIATDSKADVFATNYPSNTISEYNAGASEPSTTYTDANLSSLRYVAVDQYDNVFVSGQSAGSGSLEVDELQGSAFTPIKTIAGAVGAGIAVSPKTKTLWVCDEGDGTGGTISAYTMPGFKRRMQIVYAGDDTGIAVSKSGNAVYAIDNAPDGSQFDVSTFVYDAKTGKTITSTPSVTRPAKIVGITARK